MSELRVAELWRYPVKSLRGERLDRAELHADGFAGDRGVRVVDSRGRTITARRAHRMVGLTAAIGPGGEATIAGHSWRSPEALAEVRAVAGQDAELIADDTPQRFDEAPVLIASDGALGLLGEDHRRFRANLYISGAESLAERSWTGRRLAVGDAELRVREPCERCVITTIDPDTLAVRPDVLRRINDEFQSVLGMLCDVERPGRVAEGDAVRLI